MADDRNNGAAILDQLLGQLSVDDRVAYLAVSLVGRKPEGAHALLSLMSLAGLIARHCSLETAERVAIAERCCDC